MNWILVVPLVAFILLSAALILFLVMLRRSHKVLYKAWIADMECKNNDIHELVKSVSAARNERDTWQDLHGKLKGELARVQTDNEEFVALIADLHEIVEERDTEIKRIAMNTIEVETPKPRRSKKASNA